MLRSVIIVIVCVVALARGGSLRHFAAINPRGLPLVFGSFGLQLLIFTPFVEQALVPIATAPLYVLSMAMLVLWVWMNRQLPGIALIAAGVVMNLAAIAANGGYMPVDPAAAAYAGRLDGYSGAETLVDNNSLASAEHVRLWILTDIFPVPAGIPLANVFSLGDFLLTTGVGLFCYRTIGGRLPEAEQGGNVAVATMASQS
jgi:hypothetical protein